MSFAYLPFYTGDYFRDTRGLSMAGHGCYFLLLTYCWDTQGPLPLDEERIAGICEARNQEERNTLAKILRTYFVCMDDGWYNTRMQRELDRWNAIASKRSAAGREGATARMRKFRDRKGIVANAKQTQASVKQTQASVKQVTRSPSPSPSLKEVQERVVVADAPPRSPVPKKSNPKITNGTLLADGWNLPDEWLQWTLTSTDWDEEHVLRESLVFRDHWQSTTKNPRRRDWFKTWCNWIRRDQK